jgi:ParB family chromosome partitioning protein
MDAERSVLRCLNAFCRPGGALFVSGRPIEDAKRNNLRRVSSERKNFISFIDDDGFTAKFRGGNWYFQKYHSRATFEKSVISARLHVEQYTDNGCSFWARCSKSAELTPEEINSAIDFEFNLPLPGGKTYKRNADVMAALKEVL